MLAFPLAIMYNTSARVKKPAPLQLTHPGISRLCRTEGLWSTDCHDQRARWSRNDSQSRIADAAVEVRHGKAQAACDALSRHQGLVCLGTVGLAGLGCREVLDGLYSHERADVFDNVFPDLVHVCVDPGLELVVVGSCHASLPLGW